jgi:arylsulfatase
MTVGTGDELPAPSSMSNRLRAVVVVLVTLGTSCQGPPPPQLRVVRHLLDDLPKRSSKAPTSSAPGYVSLNDVRRPVLAASQSTHPSVVCPPETDPPSRHRRCRVSLPKRAPRAAGWILETTPIAILRANAKRAAGRKVPSPDDVRRRLWIPLPQAIPGAAPPSVTLPAWVTPFARLWPTPSIPLRDHLSQRFTVPPDAMLTFAIGTEEPAWHVDAPAVEFRVEARTSRGVTDLYRRMLDPSHRASDRGWHEATVSLASIAGQTGRLRFIVRPTRPGTLGPQLPVWGDPTILARAAPTDPRLPSVVLVSLDTLRAKSVSAFGYGLPTTPFLERFARTATRFSNVFTVYSNTFGAHIGMLTGAHPSAHAAKAGPHHLSPAIDTLAMRLRAAGYTTAAFTEDALLDAAAGFQRGFSRYWENKTIGTGAGDAPGTFGRAIAWLARHPDRPVFLFAHTYAVHAPYDPKPPYNSMFMDAGPDGPTGNRLAYEQEIRQLDDDVAALIGRLDALRDRRETLLVVTADHGEEFLEHGAFSHVQLYDEVLHVPLMMRWPGHVPAGRRIDALASLLDVTPTILDLVGLEHTARDGLSLAPLMRGEAETLSRPAVLAESPPSPWSHDQWSYVARTLSAKCFALEDHSLDRCYDLAADPGERTAIPATGNLAGLHAVARLFATLALRVRRDKPHGRRMGIGNEHPDPERAKKLRALGYVE